MSLAREAAVEVLNRYESDPAPLRDALERFFSQRSATPERERAFCRDLVFGTVQRLNTVDWALGRFSDRPLPALDPPVRNSLRLGAYQLLYLGDRVPPYAAVNEAVSAAKKTLPAAAPLVNGVLRSLERQSGALPWPDAERDPLQALSLRHSHPVWLVRRWLGRWGLEETAARLAANNESPPFSIRANALKNSRAELFRLLALEGLQVRLSERSPDGLQLLSAPSLGASAAFREGRFAVQDDSSQLAVRLLDPQPGETVMDLCAGVGGKSGHIAERMGGYGVVRALDTSAERMRMLHDSAARLGIEAIRPFLMDAREAEKEFKEAADRVLLDAPCSGLGVIRRRPDLRWNKEEKGLADKAALQRELLRAAARCLKPRGVLVYSTCTTEPEENEDVVEAFLKERPDFSPEWPGGFLPAAVKSAAGRDGYVRLAPHRHGTDGFFLARLRRRA